MSDSFTATRYLPPFTDRKEEMRHVVARLSDELNRDMHQVVMLYGPGGHGKSKLSARIASRISSSDEAERPSAPYALAFLDFDDRNSRVPHFALKSIRFQLSKACTRAFLQWPEQSFPLFDIVFKLYHERVSPGVDLEAEHPEYASKRAYLDHLVNALDLALLGIPGLIWNAVGKRKLDELIDKHFGGRLLDRDQLALLSNSELRDVLIDCLAADIDRMQWGEEEDHTTAQRKQRTVVFIDTYEALWGDTIERRGIASLRVDEWVRRLVDATPGTSYVITGRDQLQWSDCTCSNEVEQLSLQGLLRADGDKALVGAGVGDQAIRVAILDSASIASAAEDRVHPFYLALEARSYGEMSERNVKTGAALPSPGDFGGTQRDVLSRFVEHLSNEEREAIRFLSVSRAFDEALFSHLKSTFFAGSSLIFSDLANRSIFQEVTASNLLTIHSLLREHLIDEMSMREPELLRSVHSALFEWYNSRLSVDGKSSLPGNADALFSEAAHHAKQADSQYNKWLLSCSPMLIRRGKANCVLPFLQEEYSDYADTRESSQPDLDTASNHTNIARLLCSALQAEHLFEPAVSIGESTIRWLESQLPEISSQEDKVSEEHIADFARAQKGLLDFLSDAFLNPSIDEDDARTKASEIIPQALQIDPSGGTKMGHVLKSLAHLKLDLSETYEAVGGENYRAKAIKILQEAMQLAAVCMSQYDTLKFRQAFGTLLDRYGRHSEAEPQLFICSMYYVGASKAVVFGDLSKCLANQGRYEESLRCAHEARVWFADNDLREGLDTAVTKHTEANVLIELGKHDDAKELLVPALEHYEQTLSANHWYLALAYISLARNSCGRNDLQQAEEFLERAKVIELSIESRRLFHSASCLEIAAEISMLIGKLDDALDSLQQALAIYEDCEGYDRRPTRRVLRKLCAAAGQLNAPELAESYAAHLRLAMHSCTLSLQLEGIASEQLEPEEGMALVKACKANICLPDSAKGISVTRWMASCFRGISLYQFDIPTVYGPTSRYAFVREGDVTFATPLTGTNEPLHLLMAIGAVALDDRSAVHYAQIFCSGIRTDNDQFWLLFTSDRVPSQRARLDDAFLAATQTALYDVAPPECIGLDVARDAVDADIESYNEEHDADWTAEELANTPVTSLIDPTDSDNISLITLHSNASCVTVASQHSWFVQCYLIYARTLHKCIFSVTLGAPMGMLASQQLAEDPLLGFRKSISATGLIDSSHNSDSNADSRSES